jgi:uncharacterized SAM-binding protein YcdF (DUF218 family)
MLTELKPYLTAVVLPPASLLILIVVGSLLIKSNARLARRIILSCVAALWLLSTNGFSVWLHDLVIPKYPTVSAEVLKEKSVQAVVVLGAGVVTGLPGGDQQMSRTSLERLRLGAQLSRQTGLPLAFSGGAGWGARDNSVYEAEVADAVLLNAFGMRLNFKESSSRDTRQNAANSWELLSNHGINRIALVTHTSHMPRASLEFKGVGFEVVEATVGQPTLSNETILGWLPAASNLELNLSVVRELLAVLVRNLKFK